MVGTIIGSAERAVVEVKVEMKNLQALMRHYSIIGHHGLFLHMSHDLFLDHDLLL
jgi:hypothetical protein